MVTQNRPDIGAFKTPQIRNVGITAPYMHDGSMQTLWDVMDHYNKGGEANPFLDGGIEPLALSEREIDSDGGVPVHADRRPLRRREPRRARRARRRSASQAAARSATRRWPCAQVLPFERRVEGRPRRSKESTCAQRFKSVETKYYEERSELFRGSAQSRPPLLLEGVGGGRGRGRG